MIQGSLNADLQFIDFERLCDVIESPRLHCL